MIKQIMQTIIILLIMSTISHAQRWMKPIPEDLIHLQDLQYREGNPAWKLDIVYSPEISGKRATIVMIHGGGWRQGDKVDENQ